MKKMNIKIIVEGENEQAELIESRFCLEFKYLDLDIKKEEIARSSFFLLAEIRKDLERYDIYILCNGSRYDVFARGMGHAFIMRLGKVVSPSDVIDIFDPVDDRDMDKIKTVAEQEEYRQRWFDSLRLLNK